MGRLIFVVVVMAASVLLGAAYATGSLIAEVQQLEVVPAKLAPVKSQKYCDRAAVEELVLAKAERRGVPAVIALSLIEVESSWRCDAIGVNKSGGMKNADLGLMQVNARTAKGYGDDWLVHIINIDRNVDVGLNELAGHFKWAKGRTNFDRWYVALAAYNAGRGRWKVGIPHAQKVMGLVERDFGSENLADLFG